MQSGDGGKKDDKPKDASSSKETEESAGTTSRGLDLSNIPQVMEETKTKLSKDAAETNTGKDSAVEVVTQPEMADVPESSALGQNDRSDTVEPKEISAVKIKEDLSKGNENNIDVMQEKTEGISQSAPPATPSVVDETPKTTPVVETAVENQKKDDSAALPVIESKEIVTEAPPVVVPDSEPAATVQDVAKEAVEKEESLEEPTTVERENAQEQSTKPNPMSSVSAMVPENERTAIKENELSKDSLEKEKVVSETPQTDAVVPSVNEITESNTDPKQEDITDSNIPTAEGEKEGGPNDIGSDGNWVTVDATKSEDEDNQQNPETASPAEEANQEPVVTAPKVTTPKKKGAGASKQGGKRPNNKKKKGKKKK